MKAFKPVIVENQFSEGFTAIADELIPWTDTEKVDYFYEVANLMEYRPMLHILDLIEETLGCLHYYKVS